jgi:hypothetical protein
MGTHFIVGLFLACSATAMAAQAGSAQSSAAQTAAPKTLDKPISSSGCVEADHRTDEGFTLTDRRNGTYRPGRTKLHAYVGRPVPLVGGLLPSTNIAAQAGSIDPTIALMATVSGNPTGTGHPRVANRWITRVRPLTGSCPQE